MNKQRFIEFLRNPAHLSEQNLHDLEELIGEYPYFQSARTLLAKGSRQIRSKNAARFVGSAAIYATDRALLKRYLNDELIFLTPVEAHESHEAAHERELAQVIKTKRITEARIKKTPDEKIKPRKAPPEAQPENPAKEASEATEKPSNLDSIIEELYQDLEELKENRARFSEIEKQLEEDEAVNEAVQKATKKAEKDPPKKPQQSGSVRKTTKGKEPAKAPTARGEKAKPEKTPAKAPAKKAEEKKTGDTAAIDKKEDQDDPRKSAQQAIISSFIKSNPSISPAGGKAKSDVDLSGDSTVFHPETASEYLAEIYLDQGKKERAIEIYQYLMLKFPQKKSYFAGLIENLK